MTTTHDDVTAVLETLIDRRDGAVLAVAEPLQRLLEGPFGYAALLKGIRGRIAARGIPLMLEDSDAGRELRDLWLNAQYDRWGALELRPVFDLLITAAICTSLRASIQSVLYARVVCCKLDTIVAYPLKEGA